jgi:hypothetical protein
MPIPYVEPKYRSPVIPCMADFFGCDASEVFNDKEKADGYMEGVNSSTRFMNIIQETYKNRSRAFREGLLEGLREHL